ncbi:hypothetical protein VTK73DRAFT_9183 [Phialemonium thermophilum]|uniref:Hemimethylated DNA-binding domain-containing protein n=1 Tax=Phialemonium thermophilum TaxID=223376 RepID=A0ABR3W3Z3_9PEZI
MFVLHDQPQDLDYITRSLDALAKQFREAQPGVEAMPTRQKALSLVRWLRSHKLTGMDDPATNYRNLRNCFIGHALSDPDHPSLPIISSAIFCAVAERLGITSSCCSFPGHVHASVFAPPGQTLDGDDTEPGGELEVMFLDPYGSDSEVEDLRSRLAETGLPNTSDVFLSASPVPVIVQRTAQNIRTTFRWAQELPDDDPAAVRLKQLRAGHPDLNLEAAFYGAMWSQLLMRQTNSIQWDIHLNAFLNRFALTWSEDAWIVEKYLVPLYDAFMAAQPLPRHRVGWENVREILDMLHNLDRRQPTVNRRYTREIEEHVHYRIGQVFRHRRYGYIGVINGWAAGPMALPTPHYLSGDDAEEEGLGEDVASSQQLPPRRSTTYYTCLRPSVDRLRVAQENIEIVTDPSLIPESLFFLAGKFFKRFDRETCRFVSNIKEMYPDD